MFEKNQRKNLYVSSKETLKFVRFRHNLDTDRARFFADANNLMLAYISADGTGGTRFYIKILQIS